MSLIAETVAKEELKKRGGGFRERIEVGSSGTRAIEFRQSIESFERALELIKRGYYCALVNHNLYSKDDAKMVSHLLSHSNNQEYIEYRRNVVFRRVVNGLAEKTRASFLEDELKAREEFLLKRRLVYNVRGGKQTTINNRNGVIFVMSRQNMEEVFGIYKYTDLNPNVKVISDYVGIKEIADPFGLPGKEDYFEAFEDLERAVELTVEKFVEEPK